MNHTKVNYSYHQSLKYILPEELITDLSDSHSVIYHPKHEYVGCVVTR